MAKLKTLDNTGNIENNEIFASRSWQ